MRYLIKEQGDWAFQCMSEGNDVYSTKSVICLLILHVHQQGPVAGSKIAV